MKELVLRVEGMHCESCENRIKNVLGDLDGVLEVVANHHEGIVKVKLLKEGDKDAIIAAILDLGFEVLESL